MTNETKMLLAFIFEGANNVGARKADDIRRNNLTWSHPNELQWWLRWDKMTIQDTIKSLSEKSMIIPVEDGWVLSEEAITDELFDMFVEKF